MSVPRVRVRPLRRGSLLLWEYQCDHCQRSVCVSAGLAADAARRHVLRDHTQVNIRARYGAWQVACSDCHRVLGTGRRGWAVLVGLRHWCRSHCVDGGL